MKITALVENNSKHKDLLAEHGISFLIEADNKKILFDTGATDTLLKNAKQLGVDLTAIDCIALSHGHYDHVGGLEYMSDKIVYVHPDIFIPKYDKEDGKYEYAGFPHEKNHYEEKNRIEFIEINDSLQLTENIKLHVDFKKPPVTSFCLKVDDDYMPDLFFDELALSIDTPLGLVVITGCAHSGIINFIDKVIEDNKKTNIYALLGGFHLAGLNDEETKAIADQINLYKINKVGISHCTGNKLAQYLVGSEVFAFNGGDKVSSLY
ncbi:MAG: MBL fold metallo-hydrolase [Gammaproteobacteria bacterium]|nr:MBL fold metallo-hydrolase [Gammaproteobacteria bacterium]